MGQVLALVRSLSLLQLQHLFVVEKLHLFFTSVVFQGRLCQCFSCSIISAVYLSSAWWYDFISNISLRYTLVHLLF